MSQVIIEPTTSAVLCAAEVDVDLENSPGPTTFRLSAPLGASEEIVLNTINDDNTCTPIVEDTDIKKLTLANTVITTYSRIKIRLTKTATASPVGVILERPGL
jgi:hypothetical protein